MPCVFEWDEVKRKANLAKHAVDFADAIEVFADALRIERINSRRSHDEERREVIGLVGEHVLFVVYTPRGGVRRMISARRASRDERRTYLAGRPRA
jgi:uncharacterized DUF497 family protein